MLKFERKGKALELRLSSRHQNKKKLFKAFFIATSCHLLFFTLFFPQIDGENWKNLSPPIIAYVDEAPTELPHDST
ncbi:MAG: hypothetical protein WCN87_03865 [Chlamydiota bacterium]